MRHNSVVSGHSKSTGIPQVNRLLTGPSDLGRHTFGVRYTSFSNSRMEDLIRVAIIFAFSILNFLRSCLMYLIWSMILHLNILFKVQISVKLYHHAHCKLIMYTF